MKHLSRYRLRRAATATGIAFALLAASAGDVAVAHPDDADNATAKSHTLRETEAARQFAEVAAIELDELRASLEQLPLTRCVSGQAAGFSCDGVDLAAFLPLSVLGGGAGNDLWGWTHTASAREFVIMGRSTGVTFVEITNPTKPKVVGTLATHSFSSPWRDVKVYADHAYIVSEASRSGLQVFDLRRLLSHKGPPEAFSEDAHLAAFSTAHNIAINEASGFAYVVGANTCSGGLHMIDITNPSSPTTAGCYAGDGYTHDVQCVAYAGPDTDFAGRELCFASNEDTLTIVDVTDKQNPVQVARKTYVGAAYAHQGWLTEDHAYFIADDELDELSGASKTQTYVWDLADLTAPVVDFVFSGNTGAIDHNQYIRDGRAYQANYKAGLRIIDVDGVAAGAMNEVAFFDTYPQNDSIQFDGAWSSYPFYRGNVVAISTMDRGLFILGYEGERGAAHIGDLEGRSTQPFPKRWRAIATVEARTAAGAALAGATVTVRWSNGKVKSCQTDAAGRCDIKLLRYNKFAKVGFRVIDISKGDDAYASWLNRDSDGDSNGLRATVRRPTS